MRINMLFSATAVLLASAAMAGAATLSYVGTGQTMAIAGNNIAGYTLNGTTLDVITGDVKNGSNGLSVSGPAKVTYTFKGFEASLPNYSVAFGSQTFTKATAIGTMATMNVGAGGLLDFAFGTTVPASLISNDGIAVPASNSYAIGYRMLSSTSYLLLFDDITNSPDRDFDDFAVQVDVEAVPLPAAGLLLIGGLAGFGALKRRRKAA